MPSCFIEIFLDVSSEEQKIKNMKECEYLIIELNDHLDHEGIVEVCSKKKMQSDIFDVIMQSPDILEKVRNTFVVSAF